MALKPDRSYNAHEDISYFMNTTGERGKIVIHFTQGSGAAMDQSLAVVVIPSGASVGTSGLQPAGMLMNDVVNLDLTRQHINWHQDQVQVGGKVAVMRRGWGTTNAISGTPTGNETAYFTAFGLFCPSVSAGNIACVPVGRFLSKKDQDGYAKVEINIIGFPAQLTNYS